MINIKLITYKPVIYHGVLNSIYETFEALLYTYDGQQGFSEWFGVGIKKSTSTKEENLLRFTQ